MDARLGLGLAVGLTLSLLHGCTFDRTPLGPVAPEAGPAHGAPVDGARADGVPADAAPADGTPADGVDAPYDAPGDTAASDTAPPVDAAHDAKTDAATDASQGDSGPACSGALVEGFCWYASAPDQSCTAACTPHGGCNLAGTRDFAGSGGTDAKCVLVLQALGYGGYRHQSWSNNDLGCQFAWPSDPWTYWSQAVATTCEAAYPGAAHVERMCACNQ